MKIWCAKCNENVNYTVWSDHSARKHPVDGTATGKDEGADRPGHRAAGVGDAVSRKKEAKGAASGRRQKDSSGDQGTQSTKKAKVEPKEKRSHIYCCRSGDSCAIINKISLTMYIILWY